MRAARRPAGSRTAQAPQRHAFSSAPTGAQPVWTASLEAMWVVSLQRPDALAIAVLGAWLLEQPVPREAWTTWLRARPWLAALPELAVAAAGPRALRPAPAGLPQPA